MKIFTHIVFSMALLWFGGVGSAFATCASIHVHMPACPCNHSQGESGCCCDSNAPACSVNPAPVQSCACSYDRDGSSIADAAIYRTADPAIILDSALDTSDPIAFANDQAFLALPSFYSIFTPLRI